MRRKVLPPARYSFGGDEYLFIEIDEEMSLEANFKVMAVTRVLKERNLPGITEICPANTSYLVRFDPDVIHPNEVLEALKQVEREVGDATAFHLKTRITEIPVLYDDPWTRETQMRFRDRHQDPSSTDIEYAARINGYRSKEDFVAAHSASPWFVSMVGFVAGLPWLYQMVARERQIEVPKYLRPRTDTPALTIGHGGCFGCIYSVRGAGGYQMFGITPTPIFDPRQTLPDFKESMVYFRPGDIVKFRPIQKDEYEAIRADVEAGRFRFRQRPVDFVLDRFLADPDRYNKELVGVLYED